MGRKKTIVLVQLPIPSFNNQNRLNTGNLPLALGYLKAMAYKEGLFDEYEIIILDRLTSSIGGDSLILDKILSYNPDIVGFSLYLWSSLRALDFIRRLKEVNPHITIIVGGPEVSRDCPYVLNNSDIDIGVFGTAEKIFCNILSALSSSRSELRKVKGIFYRREDDRLIINPHIQSSTALEEIPSPYLAGFIDPREYNTIWIEISRGCRYRCKYCSEKSRRQQYFSLERVEQELNLVLQHQIERVIFWDSDFLTTPYFKEVCQIIERMNVNRFISPRTAIRVETLTEEKADLLKAANFEYVEVGLQSINQVPLKNVGRHFDKKSFLRAIKLLRERGIIMHTDVIIGLPGDSPEGFMRTIDFIEKHNLYSGLSWFVLSILPDTELRREADKFGFIYTPLPPYRLISSPEFKSEEIEMLKKRCFIHGKHNFFEASMATHATNYHDKTFMCAEEISGIDKIILDGRVSINEAPVLQKTTHKIARKVNCPLTLWITYTDGLKMESVRRFIEIILQENPHLYWNFLIETEKEISENILEEFQRLVFSPRLFVAEYDVRNSRIFFLFPLKNAINKKYLNKLKKHYRIFYQYTFSEGDSALEDTLRSLLQKRADGYLIDFARSSSADFVWTMYRKISESQQMKKVYFTNAILQGATYFENIVAIRDDSIETLPLLDCKNILKMEMIKWQLHGAFQT